MQKCEEASRAELLSKLVEEAQYLKDAKELLNRTFEATKQLDVVISISCQLTEVETSLAFDLLDS